MNNIVGLLCSFITSSKIPYQSFETMKKIDDIISIINDFSKKMCALRNNLIETVCNMVSIMFLLATMPRKNYKMKFSNINLVYRFILFKFTWKHVVKVFRFVRGLDDIMISCMSIMIGYTHLKGINLKVLKGYRFSMVKFVYGIVFLTLKVIRKMDEMVSAIVKISRILNGSSQYVVYRLTGEKPGKTSRNSSNKKRV